MLRMLIAMIYNKPYFGRRSALLYEIKCSHILPLSLVPILHHQSLFICPCIYHSNYKWSWQFPPALHGQFPLQHLLLPPISLVIVRQSNPILSWFLNEPQHGTHHMPTSPLQTGYLEYSTQILPMAAECACLQLWDAPKRTLLPCCILMRPFSLLWPRQWPAVPLSSYPAA